MLYQSVFRRITDPIRRIKNTLRAIRITKEMSQCVWIDVTDDEMLFLNSLRGLNGLEAKKNAFDFAISRMGYTYDKLIQDFPSYIPDKAIDSNK